jgi:hypothetical protein
METFQRLTRALYKYAVVYVMEMASVRVDCVTSKRRSQRAPGVQIRLAVNHDASVVNTEMRLDSVEIPMRKHVEVLMRR